MMWGKIRKKSTRGGGQRQDVKCRGFVEGLRRKREDFQTRSSRPSINTVVLTAKPMKVGLKAGRKKGNQRKASEGKRSSRATLHVRTRPDALWGKKEGHKEKKKKKPRKERLKGEI